MDQPTPKIRQVLKLVRYPNLLIMAGTQLFAAVSLRYDDYPLWQEVGFILTLFATLFIGAGGYIINDIIDVDADRINKPHKTIINPDNRNFYAKLYYGLSALGLILGFIANAIVGFICFIMVLLLFAYSYKLKKTVLKGNFAVAVMSGTVLLILLPVVKNISADFIWLYALFAFAVSLVREAVKDMEDEEGDRAAGYHTLPVICGITFSKKIIVIFASVQILLVSFFSLWALLHGRIWAFFYLVILVAIPSVGLALLVYWAKEKGDYSQASTLCKLIMVAGIVSMYLIN
jgi:4-hydroxybenzoate polyprenyltransferase